MRVEFFKDGVGEWRWRVRADNNSDVLATSGEGYKRQHDCEHGLLLVTKLLSAPSAEVEIVEIDRDEGVGSYGDLRALIVKHDYRIGE